MMISFKIIICILFLIFLAAPISGWDININSKIDYNGHTATGQFILGTETDSSDGIDIYDGRMIESPSYSIPFYSIIDEEYFMIDYRTSLIYNQSKVWSITQKGSRDFRNSGILNETISWDISQIPNIMKLILVDYGSDSSRTIILKEINLMTEETYSFEVTRPYGDYRYFDVIAVLTEEPLVEQDLNLNGGSGGGSSPKTQTILDQCAEQWECTSWSECSEEETQTRACDDKNECGTTNSKPSESRACFYQEQIKTESVTIEQKEESKDSSKAINSITGNVVADTKKPSKVIGFFVSLLVIIIGLSIFFVFFRK